MSAGMLEDLLVSRDGGSEPATIIGAAAVSDSGLGSSGGSGSQQSLPTEAQVHPNVFFFLFFLAPVLGNILPGYLFWHFDTVRFCYSAEVAKSFFNKLWSLERYTAACFSWSLSPCPVLWSRSNLYRFRLPAPGSGSGNTIFVTQV